MAVPRPNVTTGPLAGHVKNGRVFRSPLAATGTLQIGDWVRHDLPDLLWPVLVLSEYGTEQGFRFVRWQEAVLRDLSDSAAAGVVAQGLDGRLTGLDRLATAVPEAKAILRSRALEHGLLPESVARVLASYPHRPAEWFTELEFVPPRQSEGDLLVRAVYEAVTDGHREAIVKCITIWGGVQAGSLSLGPKAIELLKAYPTDTANRASADSAVRATWGSQQAMTPHTDEQYFEPAQKWARVFWGVNSMSTSCRRERDEVRDKGASETGEGDHEMGDQPVACESIDASAPTPVPQDGAHLRRLALDIFSSYIEALETAPARLYEKEAQEVHSGLVARAAREVITALGIADLWCMEHGSHVIRTLVEVRIYLQWMSQQDPSIYRAFQDYGAGKAKLYARILDELPEGARNVDFMEGIKEFEKLSHNDDLLDHRVVDTRDSFAEGMSIRAMAYECGLLDLYRQGYSIASGIAHSEWWSVETHAMDRCRNILHGGHLIPSLSLNAGGNVPLAQSWVDQFYALVRFSLRALETDLDAVEAAFSWRRSPADSDAEATQG